MEKFYFEESIIVSKDLEESKLEKLQESYHDNDKSEESPRYAKEGTGAMAQTQQNGKKGGVRTIPFIMGNEIFERVASSGLQANMIFYLIKVFHMTAADGTNVLFIWSAITNFLPVFGAFLADIYFGRFLVIAFGSVISLIGIALLWLSAVLPGATPPTCNFALGNCIQATPSQLALLFGAFGLMSIGAGAIRPCSPAFGADQFEKNDGPNKEKTLQTFFNLYYASVAISVIVAVIVIVYIQDKKGFGVGFGIPVVLMILSAVTFLVGSPLYHKVKGNKSMLPGLAQVIVVSWKKRRLALPPMNSQGWYHYKNGAKLIYPSNKLSFLNKACIIRNPAADLTSIGTAAKPWNLCTVQQVEDLKSIIRILPIWSTGIITAVANGQTSFPTLQAATMDRHFAGSSFQIPAASVGVFAIIFVIFCLVVYDRILVPRLAKITGHPRGLSLLQRIGIGQVLTCICMFVIAVTEMIRRQKAIEQGLENNEGIVDMSAMWLVPFHGLNGTAEVFGVIGQIEFFYSELPKSLASVAVALVALSTAIGNLMSSSIISAVRGVTGRNGRVSWVSDQLNKGHLDYYYWMLAVLAVLNAIYYFICSWRYGEEGANKIHAEEEEVAPNEAEDMTIGYSIAMSPLHAF